MTDTEPEEVEDDAMKELMASFDCPVCGQEIAGFDRHQASVNRQYHIRDEHPDQWDGHY